MTRYQRLVKKFMLFKMNALFLNHVCKWFFHFRFENSYVKDEPCSSQSMTVESDNILAKN